MLRTVVTDQEILAINCPKCLAMPGMGCRNKQRHTLVLVANSDELAFHRERCLSAESIQLTRKLGEIGIVDKMVIVHRAFVMLSAAVSAKAKVMLDKEFTPLAIEQFFINKALEQLTAEGVVTKQ